MSNRYIARYAGKEVFTELYEVIDTATGEAVSQKKLYHLANDEAKERNEGTWNGIGPMGAWLGGLSL